MLCQNCGKNEATTHIKRIINGETTETHLCAECSRALERDGLFEELGLNAPNIFSSFFGDNFRRMNQRGVRCAKCGCSFDDIVKTGLLGCDECYETFASKLMPSIRRIHGNTKYSGKTPKKVEQKPKEMTKDELIEQKQAQMQREIENQNFEQAAVLRDEIKALKNS